MATGTASISLKPPPFFLELPGEPPVPWTRWLKSFENFLIASGFEVVHDGPKRRKQERDDRRRALLLHCLGTEGQRVLETLVDTDDASSTYVAIVGRMGSHFAVPENALLRRLLFRQRHQLPGESTQQYVATLRGLASSCKFGKLLDEMVRDQLIEHTNNEKVRETLLLEPDHLLLSRALIIAQRVERECLAMFTTKHEVIPTLSSSPPPPSGPSQDPTAPDSPDPIAPDSMDPIAPPDSLDPIAPPDSLDPMAPPDSLDHIAPDSLDHIAPDSMDHIAPDSLDHMAPDSMDHIAPDSLDHMAPDSMDPMAPDSLDHMAPDSLDHMAPDSMDPMAPDSPDTCDSEVKHPQAHECRPGDLHNKTPSETYLHSEPLATYVDANGDTYMDGCTNMHITIQRGNFIPEVKRCRTCCRKFHCTFCSPENFKPARPIKLKTHLEGHFHRAVFYKGYTIHRCALGCRQKLHFHCIHCELTILSRNDFIKHLAMCKIKQNINILEPPDSTIPTSTSEDPEFPSSPPTSPTIPDMNMEFTVSTIPATLMTSATAVLAPPTILETPNDLKVENTILTTAAASVPHGLSQYVKAALKKPCPICRIMMNKNNIKKHIERKHTSPE